jgi:hypothetical protein
MVPIGAHPIISMWGEKSNFSMVLVGHQSIKRENTSSQCSSTRRYGAEVTMPHSQEKLERPSTSASFHHAK